MEERGLEGYGDPAGQGFSQIRDLEEKQQIIKDRLVLIGSNLVELKESAFEEILSIKKELATLKESLERTLSFVESLSKEISKFAKKEDVEILAKQMKMFRLT